jgi:hypothetical protein
VIAMLIENGQRADLNAIEEARSSLDAARFVVAAMWEFLAEAYDWGPDELAEFADLIGVQVAPAAHLGTAATGGSRSDPGDAASGRPGGSAARRSRPPDRADPG